MTTATDPDVEVRNADTGQVYPSQVLNEVARLDGAATDKRWTPNPDYYIPTHIATLLRPLTRAQLDAESTPEAGDHVPSVDDVREKNRLTQAKMRQLEMLDDEIAYWNTVVSRAWAKQSEAVSIISESYTAKRAAVERAYREQCEQIWGMAYHGVLSMTSRPALPVSPEGAAFLAQGPAPDEGFDTTAALNKMTGRVKTAVTGAEPEPEGTVRESRWAQLTAWFGGATTRRRQTDQDGGA